MQKFYQERFANAANFTFFFVGEFKVDEVTPLLAAYLGSLPSKGAPDSQAGALRLRFPPRSSVNGDKGREPRARR